MCLTLASSYWVPLELKGGMERKELDADTYFLDAGLDGVRTPIPLHRFPMTKYESVDLPLVMTIRRSWVLKKT